MGHQAPATGSDTLFVSFARDGATLGVFASEARLGAHLAMAALDPDRWSMLGRQVRDGHTESATTLFEKLIPGAAGDAVRRSNCRKLVLTIPAELDDVPWERLHDGSRDIGCRFAVVRRIESAPGEFPGLESSCEGARKPEGFSVASVTQETLEIGLPDTDVLLLEGPFDWATVAGRVCWPEMSASVIVASIENAAARLQLERRCRAVSAVLVTAVGPLRGDQSPRPWFDELRHALLAGATVAEAARRVRCAVERRAASGFELLVYGQGDRTLVAPSTVLVDNRRRVTVLTYDLVESTRLMLHIGSERYGQLALSFHDRCATLIRHHGGVADPHLGDDGVTSYFGFPTAREDAPGRAISCGLDLVGGVAEFGLQIRIGIATGDVAVKDGQPYGAPVVVAARIRPFSQPGQVLIDGATEALTADRFQVTPLNIGHTMKGIDKMPECFRVEGVSRSQKRRGESLQTPFVGREDELATLREHWAAVQTRSGRVVFVSGEVGIGKSRLLRELCVSIECGGGRVILASCKAEHARSAFATLIETMRDVVGVERQDDAPAVRRKVAADMPQPGLDDDAVDAVSALLAFGVVKIDEGEEPRVRRQQTLAALVAWFESAARQDALCLLVDDVHWADPSTLEFLESLTRCAAHRSLFIVFAARSEADTGWRPSSPVTTLRLKGLEAPAARAIVRRVCGAEAVIDEPLIRLLVEKGDGVPLFLEQSSRMANDLRRSGNSGPIRVPETVRDVLTMRLDLLGPSKAVAQLGAVIGREFPALLLLAVLDAVAPAIVIDDAAAKLEALEAAGLLVSVGPPRSRRLRFRHALIQDAAYDSIFETHRAPIHRAVADVLRSSFKELAERQPELLARHLAAAGCDLEAVDAWEAAARLAASRAADLESMQHAKDALAALAGTPADAERDRRELRLSMLLASRLIAIDGYGAASVEAQYLRAAELCRETADGPQRTRIDLGLESVYFMRADFDKAAFYAERALARTALTDDPLQRLQALWAKANIAFHRGDLEHALVLMDDCLAGWQPGLHRRAAVQDPAVMCLCYSAWALWERGDCNDAVHRIERVLQLAEDLRHPFSLAEAHGFAASVYGFRGELDLAMRHAEAAIAVCEDGGFAVWLAHARMIKGRLLADQGQFDAGLSEMAAGYAAWEASGAAVTRPFYLAMRAHALIEIDEIDAAQTLLDDAHALVERCCERYHLAELLRLKAECVLRRRGSDEETLVRAEQLARGAIEVARQQGKRSFALRAATTLAAVAHRRGAPADAARVLAEAIADVPQAHGTRDHRVAKQTLEAMSQAAMVEVP